LRIDFAFEDAESIVQPAVALVFRLEESPQELASLATTWGVDLYGAAIQRKQNRGAVFGLDDPVGVGQHGAVVPPTRMIDPSEATPQLFASDRTLDLTVPGTLLAAIGLDQREFGSVGELKVAKMLQSHSCHLLIALANASRES
jgi:hypothetical protein